MLGNQKTELILIKNLGFSNTEMCQILDQKMQKPKKEIKESRQGSLDLNLLYFITENRKYFDSKKRP